MQPRFVSGGYFWFGPEVTSASTRRGLITVLDQAEDLAENIPNPCKMFKIFQQNRRVASR